MDKIKHYAESLYSSIHFWWVVFGLLCIEVLSFAGFAFPPLNTIFFGVLLLAACIASLKKLHYGVLILLCDLIVNSKGYLFAAPAGSFDVSIRLGLFMTVFLAYFVWIMRDRKIRFFEWTLWKPYTALILIIALGALVGVARGNGMSNVFFDANGYLYFGLIGPFTQSVRSRADVRQLLATMLAAGTAVMFKTILLLFLFSHVSLVSDTYLTFYRWVRDTGVGEITNMKFGFFRIFFQSHIYSVFIFFFLGTWLASTTKWSRVLARSRVFLGTYALFALALLTVFLVYSRSFWVGSVATLLVAFGWFLFVEKMGVKRVFALGVGLVATFAIGIVFALGVVNFPLPGSSSISASDLITQRTKNITTENAASSRISLLRPLAEASVKNPVFGSGLGTTVTYISSDPRILEQDETGTYTTFSFEWGYLDLLLKFGVVGIVVYAYLVLLVLRYGLAAMQAGGEIRTETLGLLFGLIALLGTHFFTPYLNHPLGIGFLLMVSVIVTMNVERTPGISVLDILRKRTQKSATQGAQA